MILLFARADHPMGYGFPVAATNPDGSVVRLAGGGVACVSQAKAHGYVVLAVECEVGDEAERVVAKMAQGFHGRTTGTYAEGYLGDWYGGRFDCVAVVEGTKDDISSWPPEMNRDRVSYGDNRFFGVWTAAEVLVERPADADPSDVKP